MIKASLQQFSPIIEMALKGMCRGFRKGLIVAGVAWTKQPILLLLLFIFIHSNLLYTWRLNLYSRYSYAENISMHVLHIQDPLEATGSIWRLSWFMSAERTALGYSTLPSASFPVSE